VIEREADGDLRALAIPPFFDRVAQRAVAQVLTPGLEPLMYHGSFGYRPRRSRHTARQMIQAAYQAGYRWVYESDIDDFFDTVDWSRLRNRLTALYGDDLLVDLILRWMAAPVTYQNQLIQRSAGLPQGSPLSPLMANLILDDFDSDLENAGFRLVRFADDFLILCKDRSAAEAAAHTTAASVADLGLSLNQAKTGIRTFNQGFRYLGYLFVNGLALDVSGQREEGNAEPAPPPPRSWLAQLLRRTPQALSADGELPPKPPVAPPAVPALFIQRGEEAPEGTVVFITGPPALLTTRAGRLCLERDGETLLDHAWSGVQGIVLLGAHHITTPALRAALAQQVPVHFASGTGRYQGVTWNGQPGADSYQLWLEQQACFADPAKALAASRSVVEARLRHSREVLRQRDADGSCAAGIERIDQALAQLVQADSLSTLNGVEGWAARAYFEALKPLVPAEFGFNGRNRQPPQDPFNALLSLGYMILYAHVTTVLHASGLLPWVGFYHQRHGRHAVLASDLMEPFRHLVERTALAALTRRRLKPEDFYLDSMQGCRLQREACKQYIAMLSERFDTPLLALDGNVPQTLHGHLHDQNRALIAWIRGRAAEFKAWRMR
jgi:CRISPR-associated endonuclease Cas1